MVPNQLHVYLHERESVHLVKGEIVTRGNCYRKLDVCYNSYCHDKKSAIFFQMTHFPFQHSFTKKQTQHVTAIRCF